MTRENLLCGLQNWTEQVAEVANKSNERLMEMLGGLAVLEYNAMKESDIYYQVQSLVVDVKDELKKRFK